MQRLTFTNRRGLSLIEVLIAFFILAVGIVGVISLFPVGVQQVREAVFDTRATIVALNAESTLEMFDWANDPYLLQPPSTPLSPDALTGPAPYPGDSGYNLMPGNSAYVNLRTTFTGTTVAINASPGFPVYVDPCLANSSDFQDDPSTPAPETQFKAVVIDDPAASAFPAALTTPGYLTDFSTAPVHYYDLPIHTVSDAQLMPQTIGGTLAVNRRESFLRHWFYSDADMPFEDQNPVIPRNPSRGFNGTNGQECQPWEYYQTTLPPLISSAVSKDQARPTCERESLYSWAFSVDSRPIVNRGGAVVPSNNWKDFVRILVFYKRNLADPYRLARGCFFNRSNVATISWPVNSGGLKEISRPTLRRGGWLMEYTNTGATRSAGVGSPVHRQRITYHRIANFEDPVLDANGTDWIQTVTLEDPVVDNDFPAHTQGNLRPVPDAFTGATYFGTASPNAPIPPNTRMWVPVIFWDGLIEVFDMED